MKRCNLIVSIVLLQKRQEELQLKEEHDRVLKEANMTQILKQEENQIQQNCEQCQQVGRKNGKFSSTALRQGFQEILKAPSTGQSTPRLPLVCLSLTAELEA